MTKQEVEMLFKIANWPVCSIEFSLAQACFESFYHGEPFNSPVALTDNNLTGIMYLSEPWQHGATPGIKMPFSDTKGKLAYYAHFETLQHWAVDFRRILHLDFHHVGKPIDALTLEDYVDRLKMNGYFGGTAEEYLAGLQKFMK